MSHVILIVEQCNYWKSFGHGGRYLEGGQPQGLRQAIAAGAQLIEQLKSRESKTGTSEHNYTIWRVSFPLELIPDLRGNKFEGLKPTAPIPL